MKKHIKKYIFIITSIFILTGCSNIYEYNYDSIIDLAFNQTHIFSEDKTKKLKSNTYLNGYKMYLPEDMTLIGDLDDNIILYSYGDKYYLYTDLISYYNKKENKYQISKASYEYAKEFTYNNKNGYVIVSESKGGKLVEIMYNYAKIEVVTNDVNRAIANGIIVLKNIKYNYKIIDSLIGDNTLTYDSEQFSLLGPKENKSDNFLTYEQEYGNYSEKDNPDEDVIDYENEE